MAFYLGMDAGATKTTCAVADESRVLARVRGESIKQMRVGRERAELNLRTVVAEACAQAGISSKQIAGACAGVAGLSVPGTAEWLKALLADLTGAGHICVCGDEEIALDAAFGKGAGVLVIAGTGSNVIGRTSKGERVGAGGWGPAVGDEGSGYWIGHEALRLAFRAYDRGESSMLLARVAQAWAAANLGEVVGTANRRPAPDFSLLAPLVAECAEAGDGVATEVLLEAGRWLAEDVLLVIRKLRAAGEEELPEVAFTGSVLENVAMVREAMCEAVRAVSPTVRMAAEPVDAVMGALILARSGEGELANE